jgi:uncharacterized membrane protein YraQ (UPF0718 family)
LRSISDVPAPSPPSARKPQHPVFNSGVMVFGALAIAGAAATWWLRGPEAVWAAFKGSGGLVLLIIPVVAGGMLIGGYAQALLPREKVARWLGGESGLRGLLLATAAGACTPGGPFASFALVAALARSGADIGACITYLTAWSLLGLHRLVQWELPLFGSDLPMLRYAVSLPLPIVAGLLARLLVRWINPLPAEPATEPDA